MNLMAYHSLNANLVFHVRQLLKSAYQENAKHVSNKLLFQNQNLLSQSNRKVESAVIPVIVLMILYVMMERVQKKPSHQ